MVEVEDLKERFPTKDCPPWGNCIVIPGSEFHEAWERDLYDKGLSCVHTDFGDPSRRVVLVRLDPEGKEGKDTDTPKPSETETKRWSSKDKYKRGRWSTKDKKKLLEAIRTPASWGSGETIEERAKAILKDFPGRSLHGLVQQYTMLVKSTALESQEETLKNVCTKCGLPKDLCGCAEKKETLPQEAKRDLGLLPKKKPRTEKPSKKRKDDQEQKTSEESVKAKLDCNVSIHVEAKSAAAIKAVINLLKELKGTK